MASDVRSRVVSGVAWSAAEKVCSMLLQVGVSIVVARILSPDDFGVIAILTFFTAVSATLADSGFSQALIRSEADSDDSVKSVFVFNMTVSALLYVLCVAMADGLGTYYSLPQIADIMPVLMLTVPINAFGAVQSAILQRQLRFDVLSKIIVLSSLLSGLVAVLTALAGCGVWALVWQRVSQMVFRNGMQWMKGTWRGEGRFRLSCLRSMAPFSVRIMSSDILNSVYSNISQLFIGKIYSPTELGYFNQAQKVKDMPSMALMQSVQSVTYPALASISGDSRKFAESYRLVMAVTAFVVIPVMVGMAAVSEDMIELLIGAKWLPTAPFLKPLAALGSVFPLSMIAVNVMKVRSDGKVILGLEVAKKCVAFAALCLAIPCSTMAVAWTLGGIVLFEAVVNMAVSTRYAGIPFSRLASSVAVPLLAAGVMYVAVRMANGRMCDAGPALRLVVEVLTGASVYLLLSFRCLGARQMLSIVTSRMGRR